MGAEGSRARGQLAQSRPHATPSPPTGAPRRAAGVARQLLAALEEWARAHKLQALEVHVFPEHKQEIESLLGLGLFEYRVKMLRPLDEKPRAAASGRAR